MARKRKNEPAEIMVVNDVPGEETRVAIIENGHLEELYAERVATATNVGNIYKGRVVNVEPAIQAAFVDFGEGQNGFLHISDLHPRYFPGSEKTERVGKKMPHRNRPPIQDALKRGDEVLVQVLKEGIGTKGPTLTSYLSIPGRLLVSMPYMDRVGVSRKVEDDDARRDARQKLDDIELPPGFGFILRTAGIGRSKTDLKRDIAYLARLWKVIEKRVKKVKAPCELYTESDVLIRTIRDVVRPSIKAIIVDSANAYERVTGFLEVVAPRSAPKVVRYRRQAPIFHAFDIERQIDLIHSREVPLSSGGALVIDQTEALVAIDVNSGKSRGARDSETNAYQTNCEAIDEISRQLRLRDLGGLVILDLIDMRASKNRRLIEDRLRDKLKRDRAKTTALRISEFGLVELTRQRMRPSMQKSHFVTCPTCIGHGEIKSPDTVAADTVRHLGYLMQFDQVARVELVCSPRVASVLLSTKRRELVRLEDASKKKIVVRVSDAIPIDRVDFYAYDQRNADIDPTQLPDLKPPKIQELESEEAAARRSAEKQQDQAAASPTSDGRSPKRRGPADATAIAMEGDIDSEKADKDEESSADRKSGGKSSRRRRRRRKGGGKPQQNGAAEAASKTAPSEKTASPDKEDKRAPAAVSDNVDDDDGRKSRRETRRRRRKRRSSGESKQQPAEAQQPQAEREESPDNNERVRVHTLAKDIGVKSKEILHRATGADDMDLKNHMSTVTPEQAERIAGWFKVKPDELTVVASDEKDAGGPDGTGGEGDRGAGNKSGRSRRSRRSRGGRKSSTGARDAGSSNEQTQNADEDPGAKSEKKGSTADGDAGKKHTAAAESDEQDRSDDQSAAGGGASSNGQNKRSRRKRRRRGRGGGTQSAGDNDDAQQQSADSKEDDDKRSDNAENPEIVTTSTTPKSPPRRSLYRSRKRVSPITREAAEPAT